MADYTPPRVDLVRKALDAGYTSDEVNGYLAPRIAAARAAGYSDAEINDFLGTPQTGPQQPAPIPKPFIERFLSDTATSYGTALKTIDESIKGLKDGWPGDPVGLDPQTEQELRNAGVMSDPTTGRLGPLRRLNDTLVPAAAYLGDLVAHVGSSVATAAGRAIGTISEGENPGSGERAQRETVNFANFLAIESMLRAGAEPITKVDIGADGKPMDVQITRGLPKPEDFTTAAEAFGDAQVAPKLLRLYNEKGVPPAEVLHDAQHDVTITQDLLASGDNLPTAYGGGIPPAKPPVEPPVGGSAAAEGGNGPGPVNPPAAGTLEEARQKILSKISIGEFDKPQPLTFDQLYTRVIDDLNPVKKAVKNATDEALPVGEDPYALFRLTRGTFGKADQFLVNSPFDFNTYQNVGKSLKAILAPVKDDLDNFRAYAASARAIELQNRGIEPGFDMEAAGKVAAFDAERYDGVLKGLVGYQNSLTKYLKDSGILSEKGYQQMLTANLDYVPFYRLLDPGMDGGRGAGGGLAAKNPVKAIKGSLRGIHDPLESIIKNTYAYIALAEKNAAGVKLVDILKEADKGATFERPVSAGGAPTKAPTEPPSAPAIEGPKPAQIEGPGGAQIEGSKPGYLESQWSSNPPAKAAGTEVGPSLTRVDEGAKPLTDAEFEEIAAETGVDKDTLATITTAARQPEGQTIRVFRDGKPETYRINDPDLIDAWRGLDSQTAGLLQKILGAPARTLRAGSTLTPDFIARNIIRDFFSAVVNTKGALFSPIDTFKGLKGIVAKDADFQNWLKGGGANSALVSMDRRYLQENLFKLNQETGLMRRGWNVVTSPLRGLRMLSELVENSTRLGEFKKVAGGATDKATIQAGAYSSREVTLDFARIGSEMRAYNMITAFANANIQGVDRLARAFKENPVGTSVKIAAGITLPSIMLWMHNRNEPRYQHLPDWEKDLFWIIPTDNWRPAKSGDIFPPYLTRTVNGQRQVNDGTIWRIPKPFETGVVFGSGVERALDAWVAKNPKAFEGFFSSASGALFPSFVPTIAQPMVEQFANRSTFTGEPLVPDRVEQQLPEYRYNPYTTELAKTLGRLAGAVPPIHDLAMTGEGSFPNGVARALTSPALIENYVRAWSGGLGTYALQITDRALKQAGVLVDVAQPLSTLADIPVVKAFTVRYPTMGVKPVQDFYDRNGQAAMVWATVRAQAQAGNPKAYDIFTKENSNMTQLDGIQKAIGGQSALIRMVWADPKMKPYEKRQLIDTYYYRIIELATIGNRMLDSVKLK